MRFLSLGLFILVMIISGCQTNNVKPKLPKISIQLWSVKTSLEENYDQTISELAKMGFQGVELAGYFGPYKNDLKGFLALLQKHQLAISSAHVSTDALSPENIDTTISTYKLLGVDTLILPWEDRAYDTNKIDELILELNRIQSRLKQSAIRFGFHNHDKEFNQYKGSTFWDAIAQGTDNEFILQLDTGWVNKAGKNPVNYIKKYPNRTKLAHFKAKLQHPATNKRPIIGQDDIDWQNVLHASISDGGLEWLIIEQEEYPDNLSPLESVALSKQGIDNVIKNYR